MLDLRQENRPDNPLKCHPSYVCAFCGKTTLIDAYGLPDQVSQADRMIEGLQVILRHTHY